MSKLANRSYTKSLVRLIKEKSSILSKAQALTEMGMAETALSLWQSAANYEERIAPLLEALGRHLEAAVHRISAASCYRRAGDPSRAANLLRAALAGPLRKKQRQEVEETLANCLRQLSRVSAAGNGRA